MRDYGKVSPRFWTGRTGKAIKAEGFEAVLVALYLMTSPHADMLGVYYLPMVYIAHDTGLPLAEACKGLEGCIRAGFCAYDRALELVWVRKMALYQVGAALQFKDNRVKAVEKAFLELPVCEHLSGFYGLYRGHFHLPEHPGLAGQASVPPLAGQEQGGGQAAAPSELAAGGKLSAGELLLAEYGVGAELARDFIAHRLAKKSPITKTMLAGLVREAEAEVARLTVAEAMQLCIERNWQGFKAEWVVGGKAAVSGRAAPMYVPKEQRGTAGLVIESTATRMV